ALHVLEMEGFVESFPRIGYRVKQIRWDEVDEICEIRKGNETLAARWAVERITPQELISLQKNLEAATADIEKGTPERFIEWDADFHEILVKASGSQRLLEICQGLRRHMFLYRIKSVYKAESAILAIEGHQAILSRLRERDAIGVENAIRDHLDHAKRSIRQHAFEQS
ncbi:MAG: GntR family transcriptional regulator, partial [Geobacter sp.]